MKSFNFLSNLVEKILRDEKKIFKKKEEDRFSSTVQLVKNSSCDIFLPLVHFQSQNFIEKK